jgi:hypothetical protein
MRLGRCRQGLVLEALPPLAEERSQPAFQLAASDVHWVGQHSTSQRKGAGFDSETGASSAMSRGGLSAVSLSKPRHGPPKGEPDKGDEQREDSPDPHAAVQSETPACLINPDGGPALLLTPGRYYV